MPPKLRSVRFGPDLRVKGGIEALEIGAAPAKEAFSLLLGFAESPAGWHVAGGYKARAMPIRREAEPEAKARRAFSRVEPGEPLQDDLVLAGRDAGTGIGDGEKDAVLSLGCCQLKTSVWGRL